MGKKTLSKEKKVVVKSLIDSGASYRDVQKVIPVSIGYITKIVREFESNKELVDAYKENRIDILLQAQVEDMALQSAIRASIDETEIDKWTPDQKARWHMTLSTDFGIKFDKERLERGESTENVSVIMKTIRDARRRRDADIPPARRVGIAGVSE